MCVCVLVHQQQCEHQIPSLFKLNRPQLQHTHTHSVTGTHTSVPPSVLRMPVVDPFNRKWKGERERVHMGIYPSANRDDHPGNVAVPVRVPTAPSVSRSGGNHRAHLSIVQLAQLKVQVTKWKNAWIGSWKMVASAESGKGKGVKLCDCPNAGACKAHL